MTSQQLDPEATRVFIVEDHPVFAAGLAQLIDTEAGLCTCGVASSAQMALDFAARKEFDVMVVDLSLGDSSGLDVIKTVTRDDPGARILAVSMHEESLYGERVLRAGAFGYVMKSESGATILRAIRAVAEGKLSVSDALGTRMLLKVARGSAAGSKLDGLSDREIEIFDLIGRGRRSDEISRVLHISKKTVESHRLNLRSKLKLQSGLDLVRHAMASVHERTLGTKR